MVHTAPAQRRHPTAMLSTNCSSLSLSFVRGRGTWPTLIDDQMRFFKYCVCGHKGNASCLIRTKVGNGADGTEWRDQGNVMSERHVTQSTKLVSSSVAYLNVGDYRNMDTRADGTVRQETERGAASVGYQVHSCHVCNAPVNINVSWTFSIWHNIFPLKRAVDSSGIGNSRPFLRVNSLH